MLMQESLNMDTLSIPIDSLNNIEPIIAQVAQPESDFLFGLSTAELRVVVAVVIPLLILLISNIVVLIKIRLDSNESIRKELTLVAIGSLKERLEKFYNPLVALLDVNTRIFNFHITLIYKLI